jgi:hypothetical protein
MAVASRPFGGQLATLLLQHPMVRERAATLGLHANFTKKHCTICDEMTYEFDFQSPGCGHSFCFGCMQQWMEHEVNSGALQVRCPHAGCQAPVPHAWMMANMRNQKLFKRYDEVGPDDMEP